MLFSGKIFSRYAALTVIFTSSEEHEIYFSVRGSSGIDAPVEDIDIMEISSLADIARELSSMPVMLFLGGYGVIRKDLGEDVDMISEIRSNGEDFIITEHEGQITFTRKTRAEKVIGLLAEHKAKVVSTVCLTAESRTLTVTAALDRSDYISKKQLKLKALVQPTVEGSMLATLFARKLRLPVLGACLLVLMLNMFISSDLQTKLQNSRVSLEGIRKAKNREDEVSENQRAMLANFDKSLPYDYSYILDRIGLAVPEGVSLNTLWVHPLLKKPENNKEIVLKDSTIEITGQAAESENVSQYIYALGKLRVSNNISLSSIEKEREKGVYLFRMILKI